MKRGFVWHGFCASGPAIAGNDGRAVGGRRGGEALPGIPSSTLAVWMDIEVVIGLVLGVAGLALTVGFEVGALKQRRRSHEAIASQIGEIRERIILMSPTTGPEKGANAAEQAGRADFVAVEYADVNNDGKNELLIQHWAGNHGSALRVMGWREDPFPEFEDLASLSTGTPEGFTVGDLDGDGQIEIATVDADYAREIAPGRTASYADGAREEILYRWDGGSFREIGRRQLPLHQGPGSRLWHTNPLPLLPASHD